MIVQGLIYTYFFFWYQWWDGDLFDSSWYEDEDSIFYWLKADSTTSTSLSNSLSKLLAADKVHWFVLDKMLLIILNEWETQIGARSGTDSKSWSRIFKWRSLILDLINSWSVNKISTVSMSKLRNSNCSGYTAPVPRCGAGAGAEAQCWARGVISHSLIELSS